ncbi:Uracil-DNA glycosylase [Strongyloides ratti]|uniref:Uracil-DNA glycosylase n=1 Tax=Strongyloides ratti TaxID=34506 RepID=A0A090L490_STRRB|nr:Uracil-DNA glycosylase [Strongyloides ratti]CEF64537.1 Uracil-DNA glycosylase [Strongyloides ratti]
MSGRQTKLTDLFKVLPSTTASPNNRPNLTTGVKRKVDMDSETSSENPIKKKIESGDKENVVAKKINLDEFVSTKSNVYSINSLLAPVQHVKWRMLLGDEMKKKYFTEILVKLNKEVEKSTKIFPPLPLTFNAFAQTDFDDIKVVLIGQDPYHNDNQAHGLCFSVPKTTPPPPSLKNIYTELKENYPDFVIPNHGFLEKWAKNGMFMLNATLTVEAHKANSHASFGWQTFTDNVIKIINKESKKGIVFLLWGGFAGKKESLIDLKKHKVVKSAHPSPLSARLFKGCKCFKKVDDALVELGRTPFNWNCLTDD